MVEEGRGQNWESLRAGGDDAPYFIFRPARRFDEFVICARTSICHMQRSRTLTGRRVRQVAHVLGP
jgi:hypothetical protein